MDDRLTKAEWIACGLDTLSREGASALKVGPLAVKLNVSRGSFYWHFKDIAAYRANLLARWLEQSTDQVIETLEGEPDAPDRLKRLMRRAFNRQSPPERAIRAWALQDGEVASAVASVDARRVGYIGVLLRSAGVSPAKAASRAAFVYWAYLGQAAIVGPSPATLTSAALDDISQLIESRTGVRD
ncbi:MAG: TetR/AcrR family transcriptional regulator [Alphaproteobacteria bacterium]|nr:TetR/AcrR family transcriptional regulator [Alphaproteobacteria bacterium]